MPNKRVQLKNIDFLDDTEFEELCFELLQELGFVNVDWRKGTALSSSPCDRGRDIVAQHDRTDIDGAKHLETWFVDCKRYKKGAPPEKLQGLLTWPAAERPHVALFIASGYMSNPAKDFLRGYELNNRPPFRIKYWERPALERLGSGHEDLIRRFLFDVPRNESGIIAAQEEFFDIYCETATAEWRETVGLFTYMRTEADELIEWISSGHRDELDPAIPCLTALVWDIGRRLGQFMLIHDESKVVARHALTLLNTHELLDPTRPGKHLPQLPAVTIEFSSSIDIPQLQIADWIAGAGRQWSTELAARKGDRFAEQVGPIVNKWLTGALWPDPETIDHPSPRRIE